MNDQARRIAEALLDEYKLGHSGDESRSARDFDEAELEDVAEVVEKAIGKPVADSRPFAAFVFVHEGENYVLQKDYERLRAMLVSALDSDSPEPPEVER